MKGARKEHVNIEMSIEEGVELFKAISKIEEKSQALKDLDTLLYALGLTRNRPKSPKLQEITANTERNS